MRIGIDLGGTKIEGIILNPDGEVLQRQRIDTPAENYHAIIENITGLVNQLEKELGQQGLPVGVGQPGTSAADGRVKNSNTTVLNGHNLKQDLEQKLGRTVRTANDANCFVLSEALQGAGRNYGTVFGVILGTGVGGGLVINGKIIDGPNGIAGEWGHCQMPGLSSQQLSESRVCYCGRPNCIETWLCGAGLARTFNACQGAAPSEPVRNAKHVYSLAKANNYQALAAMDIYYEQLAIAIAQVINILDPHCVVLGGGVSNIEDIYREVPKRWGKYVFSPDVATQLLKAEHGDSSGVFGAAWLNE